ncbi:polymorphic toxin-type HINT domain-containing protein [Moraxella sp. Tifton1]|nr:polymorphic toxin-type HINT domain-containing protein [Moraxella sp. Tifton1]
MKDTGWLKASLLEQGMILLDRNNQEVEVLSQFLIPNRTDTVYNIEVDDFHTYHVGRLGVWVHNADCCDLKYEAAPYHGSVGNAVKSKAPTNPQQMLDVSIKIKDTSDRRIAVDKSTGEFVIFDKTIDNIYHGHVRTWDELTQEMKNVLIGSGLVNKKGKIK